MDSPVRLSFAGLLLCGATGGLIAGISACSQAQEPSRAPPNIVLISLDNLGARHLGAYGSERDTSPFLDSLARQGVLFENAHSQSTWTLPAHASLLSSRYVGAHSVWNMERQLPRQATLVQEVLGEAGYQTSAFTSCVFVSELYGFDRGFDHMSTSELPAQRMQPAIVKHLERQSQRGEQPFFLFLHYYDVHQPFSEPNPYGEDFATGLPDGPLDEAWALVDLLGRRAREVSDEDVQWLSGLFPELDVEAHMQAAREADAVLDERLMKFVYRYLAELGPEALAARKARYDNGVANMDARLAELFDALRSFDWYEDTVFVITADHGESFNDPPGVLGHGGEPYREQSHVPLIVFGPGIPQGVRVETPVAGIDVGPTLLELAGLDVPEDFQGAPLSSLFEGAASPSSGRRRPVLTGVRSSGRVSIVEGPWKLITGGDLGSEMPANTAAINADADADCPIELYDLSQPSRANERLQHPEVVSRLHDWLRLIEQRNAGLAQQLDYESVLLDAETQARLAELGYVK